MIASLTSKRAGHSVKRMASLFEPLRLRGLTARNRIWVAPMCQYSCFAGDGMPTSWHLVHLGSRAAGGFGLVLAEASAVAPDGRITSHDAGIWSEAHARAWEPIVDFIQAQGALAGIQLAHAGRKASTSSPLTGERGSVPRDQGGWATLSSSDQPFTGLAAPRAMSLDEIAALPEQFAEAARHADRAGFDLVEIHAAHGYLLHQFLSPLVNERTDRYGGCFEDRARLIVEVVEAVRAAWPGGKPLLMRLSATDWAPDGWDVAQTVALSALVAERGVDLVDLSSGGAVAEQEITTGPGYQVPFARAVREQANVATSAVGLITDPGHAQSIVTGGDADAVMLARAAIREPNWPWRAAHELGIPWREAPYPPQYTRGAWR